MDALATGGTVDQKADVFRYDIEGLRALAIVPVVLFHLGMPSLSGGFVGVDIFFVISGFLITKVISEEIKKQSFTIAGFYNRRIKRIFPGLYLCIAICIAFSFLLLPGDRTAFFNSIWSVGIFSSNLYFWVTASYFDAPSHTKPLLHTWSLSVEEQFYIFYPFVLIGLRQASRTTKLMVLTGLAAVSFVVCLWLSQHEPSGAFYLPYSRAWELLVGAIVSIGTFSIPAGWRRDGLAAVGAISIIASLFVIDAAAPFPGWAALFPVLGTALIIACNGGTMVAGTLSVRPARFIGRISYSWYLWHWPTIVFFKYYFIEVSPLETGVACFIVSLALSIAAFYAVEMPLRRQKTSIRTVLVSGLGLSALFITVGLTGRLTHGFDAQPHLADSIVGEPEDYFRGACFLDDDKTFGDWRAARCQFPAKTPDAKQFVIWGDSYAAHLTPGFLDLKTRTDFALAEIAMTGCPPLLDYDEPGRVNCRSFTKDAFDWIKRQRPDVVIVSARWNRYRNFALVRTKLEDTISKLHAAGIGVMLIGEEPTFEDPVPQIREMLKRRGLAAEWFVPDNVFKADQSIAAIAAKNDSLFFAPRQVFCKAEKCRIAIGDKALQWDTGHLTDVGSKALVEAVAPLLPLATP